MKFIDTHSHIYDEAFNEDIDATIERAINNKVTKIILPDIDSQSRDSMFDLASKYPENLFPCLGLHPTSIEANWENEFNLLNKYKDEKIYAIGEIGIDCYWSKEFLEEQKKVFIDQLHLAQQLDLPVIIHSRESTKIILDILKEYKYLSLRGVFHAYSGSIESYRELQDLGNWYIGLGGVITYKKASIAETLKDIPLDRILLETDSPYLSPVPYRGKRNESSYIPIIAGKIAELKNISLYEVAEATTKNAENLFKI